MDKKILRDISYGMYIVTAKDDKKVGCTVNTLTQVTSENPIISICLNKDNYTNEIIRKTKKFGVSIISEKTNPNVIATFGFKSSKDTDKYENITYEEKEEIPVIKENTCGYIICEVINIIDAETHDIITARIIKSEKTNDFNPMTYKYYHEVIKGKAPKKAPTYTEEEVTEEVFVCDTCGYVHKGKLPKDFVCPICGMDYTHFKRK